MQERRADRAAHGSGGGTPPSSCCSPDPRPGFLFSAAPRFCAPGSSSALQNLLRLRICRTQAAIFFIQRCRPLLLLRVCRTQIYH
ncbi:hypothetical protein EJB05_40648 [Eragrostis curvula]|uniref:Uncharacterized protein n=1 Tax=Eragrostis curvula TaxID=38414 RepID=A0A5J9TRW5_9POAL|nr:hypothetical protein EJB05_40648 [Eragrostis curvula]